MIFSFMAGIAYLGRPDEFLRRLDADDSRDHRHLEAVIVPSRHYYALPIRASEECAMSLALSASPIVEANARFLLSATDEDVLTINAEIQHWGKRSLRVEYNGFCGPRQIFSGFEVRVWLKRANDGSPQAAAIPNAFKDAFGAP